jgi:hypothetical protein
MLLSDKSASLSNHQYTLPIALLANTSLADHIFHHLIVLAALVKLALPVIFHVAFNHQLTILVHNSATASISSATHTGSSFIALANASQLPYLFRIA